MKISAHNDFVKIRNSMFIYIWHEKNFLELARSVSEKRKAYKV